ncbi:hypothetical protein PM082_000464 [Marasmius tenuissimus]|nr:hypothetical protein PM082_000464 [Marasmius tenuissimus]
MTTLVWTDKDQSSFFSLCYVDSISSIVARKPRLRPELQSSGWGQAGDFANHCGFSTISRCKGEKQRRFGASSPSQPELRTGEPQLCLAPVGGVGSLGPSYGKTTTFLYTKGSIHQNLTSVVLGAMAGIHGSLSVFMFSLLVWASVETGSSSSSLLPGRDNISGRGSYFGIHGDLFYDWTSGMADLVGIHAGHLVKHRGDDHGETVRQSKILTSDRCEDRGSVRKPPLTSGMYGIAGKAQRETLERQAA